MRVAIVTSGRFHVLDLARELFNLGHQVRFYSYVPRNRAERFGLPRECHHPLLPYVRPLGALQQRGPSRLKEKADTLLQRAIDRLACRLVKSCEVFIGMSGLCVQSALAARKRFGAKVFIERGSRHILSQKEILENIPVAPGAKQPCVSVFNMQRELAGYELADVIVVPSLHAQESFVERGVAKEKVFRNPYGVDLAMFLPTPVPQTNPATILFVGAWSLQKGCDVLAEAWRSLPDTRLMHVGPAGDAVLPRHPNFVHHDAVPQWELKEFFGQAHVFAIASRQEGLSLVQAQALACGLPLVCTTRTGGEDLREFVPDPDQITVVPPDDSTALANALRQALGKVRAGSGLRDNLGNAREKLSWRGYGERYDACLRQRVSPLTGFRSAET